MLSRNENLSLKDIEENILKTRQFIHEVNFRQFSEDERTIYAIIWCLEIVSEASRRLKPATKQKYPQINWNEVVAAGNVYRHEYHRLNLRRVWNTVNEDVSDLLLAIQAELATRTP